MINIIRADIYRISRSVGFYIALAAMFLMIGMSVYCVSPGTIGSVSVGDVSTTDALSKEENEIQGMSVEEMRDLSIGEYRKLMLKSKGYALDRDILGYNMNLYYIFIFIAALAVTVDFSAGSAKNSLSSAISRRKYFLSKITVITVFCLVIFFLNTYISYFSNFIFNGKNLSSSLLAVTKISLLQLPPILALISILSGIAFTVKKTSIFNTIAIPLVIVFQLIFGLISQLFDINSKYTGYELQIMLGKLSNNPSDSFVFKSYILCAAIIIVFTVIGWLAFRKSEIK